MGIVTDTDTVEQVHGQRVTSRQAGNHRSWSLLSFFQISIFYDIYFLPPMSTMYPALSFQRISRWQHTRLKHTTPYLISTHLSFNRLPSTVKILAVVQ